LNRHPGLDPGSGQYERLACERRGGASLRRAWLGLLAWIGVPVLLLAGVAAAIWAALR